MDIPRLAYSYIRFSSEQQRLGDSLKRQVALAEAYALEHGLELDTHTYRDLGLSAFKGRNAVQGKLATFLRAVDAGFIEPGSYLLVESLDRLSRTDVDEALELFLSIIRRGLTIVTLTDGQIYCTDTIKRDHGISLIISITVMMRAHDESATKSARIKAAWKARTARGGVLIKRGPAWINWVGDRWEIDTTKAKVIRWIYRMYLKGYGSTVIERQLNEHNVPTLRSARYWSPGLVTRILSNRAVYGTLQRKHDPDIENYYPAIINREIFERVRLLAKTRTWSGATPHRVGTSGFFIAPTVCAGCGERMRVVSGHFEAYTMQCSRAYNHAGCSGRRVSGTAADKALVEHLLTQPIELEQSPLVREAQAKFEEAEAQIKVKRELRDSLARQALKAIDPAELRARIAELETEVLAHHRDKEKLHRLIYPLHLRDLAEARKLCAAISNARTPKEDRVALRQQLLTLTHRIFLQVSFDPAKLAMTLTYACGPVVTIPTPAVHGGFYIGNGYANLRKDRRPKIWTSSGASLREAFTASDDLRESRATAPEIPVTLKQQLREVRGRH